MKIVLRIPHQSLMRMFVMSFFKLWLIVEEFEGASNILELLKTASESFEVQLQQMGL